MDSHIYFSVKREIQILLPHHNILLEKNRSSAPKKNCWEIFKDPSVSSRCFVIELLLHPFHALHYIATAVLLSNVHCLLYSAAQCTCASAHETVHFSLATVYCSLFTVLCSLFTVLCSLCSVHWAVQWCKTIVNYSWLYLRACRIGN